MQIGLIGYGKMGQTIEVLARQAGHNIKCIIDVGDSLSHLLVEKLDLAIEFTQPDAAKSNLSFCLSHSIPVISGTTGWLDSYTEIVELCQQNEGTFFYASNYSIGVNLFFELNRKLAEMMTNRDYYAELLEIHHAEKKDAPSGTAISLARQIMDKNPMYKFWSREKNRENALSIHSQRTGNHPGTHVVSYTAAMETISIKHEAKDRQIFAQGVIKVAEWIHTRKGIFTMSDFLNDI